MKRDEIHTIDDVVSSQNYSTLMKFVQHVPMTRVEKPSRRHSIADGFALDNIDPTVSDFLIELCLDCAERAGFGDVQSSPWERSAVSLKKYLEGDFHASHLDTNSISAVLMMAPAKSGGDTVFSGGRRVAAEANRLVLFRGSEMWHYVEPVLDGMKVCFVVNLYDSNLPISRPFGTDELVYG